MHALRQKEAMVTAHLRQGNAEIETDSNVANHYLLMPESDSHTALHVEGAVPLWGHGGFSGRD